MHKAMDAVDALTLLVGASLAHHFHFYLLSIPVAIFAIVLLGNILKKELGI